EVFGVVLIRFRQLPRCSTTRSRRMQTGAPIVPLESLVHAARDGHVASKLFEKMVSDFARDVLFRKRRVIPFGYFSCGLHGRQPVGGPSLRIELDVGCGFEDRRVVDGAIRKLAPKIGERFGRSVITWNERTAHGPAESAHEIDARTSYRFDAIDVRRDLRHST